MPILRGGIGQGAFSLYAKAAGFTDSRQKGEIGLGKLQIFLSQ
jgi:hypothetical protein